MSSYFTPKSPAARMLMASITGKPRRVGECVFDEGSFEERHDMNFRDDLSRSEYRISGMCQSCQDMVFEFGGGDVVEA